ncbi:GNAT family N-acetyltransferase [Micromonosporaceae bacterium Da 78-11]
MHIDLEEVTGANWRGCAALTLRDDQQEFVSPVAYSLCVCAYGDTWHPLAATRDGEVVGFVMWAVDDDGSRWIGGLAVDARHQRQGVGGEIVRRLRERLIAEPGCPNVALSYTTENESARRLYLSLGFVETGETEDDELVTRWTP